MLPCLGPAQVGGLGRLLDIPAGNLEGGLVGFAKERCRRGVLGIDNEAVEEPADDVGGVREVKIDARQGSHPGPRSRPRPPRPRPSSSPCPGPFRPRRSRETGDGWEDGSWVGLDELCGNGMGRRRDHGHDNRRVGMGQAAGRSVFSMLDRFAPGAKSVRVCGSHRNPPEPEPPHSVFWTFAQRGA